MSGSTPSRENKGYWGGGIPWVSPKDMKTVTISDSLEHITEEALRQTGLKLLDPPVILIVVRGMILAHTFPVARTLAPVTINQDMKALKLRDGLFPNFITYLLSGMQPLILAEVQEAGHGTRRLPTEAWKNIKIWLPPVQEQNAITDFLDRETVRIDHLIEQKQRLIELLEEKRTALITGAVTKGLNPDVEMKDSGVKWLEEIPAHWEVAPLKRYWKVIDCKHRTVPFSDEGIPVVSIGEVTGLEVELGSAKCTSESEYRLMIEGGRKPMIGDLVYSRNATVGSVARVVGTSPFCLGQDVCLIRSIEHSSEFLLYLLRSRFILAQLDRLMVGSTFRRINVGQIKNFILPVPPVSEQIEIASLCVRVHDTHAGLIREIEAAQDLLREYRTALISAAVTGKIDVRDHAA